MKKIHIIGIIVIAVAIGVILHRYKAALRIRILLRPSVTQKQNTMW